MVSSAVDDGCSFLLTPLMKERYHWVLRIVYRCNTKLSYLLFYKKGQVVNYYKMSHKLKKLVSPVCINLRGTIQINYCTVHKYTVQYSSLAGWLAGRTVSTTRISRAQNKKLWPRRTVGPFHLLLKEIFFGDNGTVPYHTGRYHNS